MKVSYAFALLALVAAVAASQQTASDGQKSVVVSPPVQQPYQLPAAVVPYPGQNYQFASEYVSPYAKSASFAPKAAPTAVPSSFGVYQPYQQQQYNYGPYQQYYPGSSGYPAVVAAGAPYYPTAYSAQPAAAGAYPTPYSAYPYGAQPYHHGSSYSSYPAAAAAYQSYNGQFAAPSAAAPAASSPYSSSQYSAVTPYSALPSVYQHQQHSSYYNPAAVGQQYSPSQQYGPAQSYSQSQQYLSQQYPSSSSSSSYYPNSASATATADQAVKVSSSAAEKK